MKVEKAGEPTAGVRVDVWLDVACLFRTRSEAQRACNGGKIEVNGQPTKPHRLVKVGDQLRITRMFGVRQTISIRALADQHMPRADARHLYEDTTPPPSPEEVAVRRAERLFRMSRPAGAGAPGKRDRRLLRRLKRQD
jgi:ribosome-associated heat shock protein Hsp15